jgi:hypothetical protein
MEVRGLNELLAKLDQKFAKAKVDQVVNKALRTEAGTEVDELSGALRAAYADTGISAEGVTHGNVSRSSGVPIIKMGNSGEHWRLIHLNEFGYTEDGVYHPGAGNGVMTKFVENQAQEYKNRIANNLEELLL